MYTLHDTIDEAADTLRFVRFDTDPDATSCYVLDERVVACCRLIGTTRHDVARLREAIASGWDVGPELAHEERQLATLEGHRAARSGARHYRGTENE
jgi:hypothetical protein